MKILYGVTGEGLGHAMRSRVVAEHLLARGHDIKLVASGRAHAYLAKRFTDVQPIPGLAMTYVRGKVARARTLVALGRNARRTLHDSIALYRRAISGYQPDVCISDFDSFSHVFGLLFDRPVISIDHQHVIDRCEHAPEIARRLPRDFAVTRAIVRAKLPRCRHYIVTSFYRPPARRAHTTLVGPILRSEVLALAPRDDGHVLVYQTGHATPALLAALREIRDQRFVVYARDVAHGGDNVEVHAFDERRFLDHLASARAVICNGGYTLMAEALHLGKPILSVPLRHQGEQELNAAYLDALGLGRTTRELDASTIRTFVRHARPIAPVPAGNAHALRTIDHLLETT